MRILYIVNFNKEYDLWGHWQIGPIQTTQTLRQKQIIHTTSRGEQTHRGRKRDKQLLMWWFIWIQHDNMIIQHNSVWRNMFAFLHSLPPTRQPNMSNTRVRPVGRESTTDATMTLFVCVRLKCWSKRWSVHFREALWSQLHSYADESHQGLLACCEDTEHKQSDSWLQFLRTSCCIWKGANAVIS